MNVTVVELMRPGCEKTLKGKIMPVCGQQPGVPPLRCEHTRASRCLQIQ